MRSSARTRFTGQTCDDLAVILNGALHMASENNDCTPGSGWTLGSAVPRQTNHVTGDTTNYNTSDWSSVQQEVVLPATTATNSKPALVTLEDDNGVPTLWEYEFKGTSIDQAILLATGSAWGNVTILSPGLINGTPALWVRDNATGSLTQYQNIESWSTAGGTSTTGDSIATSGYNAQQYPMITTNGPTDTTNGPTLWAVDASGRLTCLPTTVNATTFILAVGPAVPLTSTGWAAGIQNLGTAAVPDSPGYGDIWPLSSTTQGNDIGFDSLGEATTPGSPATSSGTITYTTGHDGAVNGATVFDGSTTSLTTSTDAVDTSGSYSVSAWVKLNSASANSVFVTQGNSTTGPVADGFQLYYSATAGSYAFGRHVSGSSGAAFSPIYATAQATTNTWTHLVGVFNAATNTMTLYINGVPAATGSYSGADWSANGAVQIGRGINSGTFNQYANAAIDQVAVYGTALTAAQVAAL
jgi:hypothetical protein